MNRSILLCTLLYICIGSIISTPLQDFIAKRDDSFKWEILNVKTETLYTTYLVKLTSQKWLTNDLRESLWQHELIIVVPHEVSSSTAFLFIGGGKNSDPPTSANVVLLTLAVMSKTVVAEIRQIPNQPLTFFGDEKRKSRIEDAILAYSNMQFYHTLDPEWVTLFPMVKAVVKAMDVIQEHISTVQSFVVSGASKRGWTTWLTAAVDTRVIGIVPIVIDLKLVSQLNHHWMSYGSWSPALDDYSTLGVLNWLNTPENVQLSQLIDPMSFKEKLTMPKYIVLATQDEFFLPDGARFYYDDLPAPKYLRYVPNSGHYVDLAQNNLISSIYAFYSSILNRVSLPEISWSYFNDSVTGSPSIKMQVIRGTVQKVTMWEAYNPKARQFCRWLNIPYIPTYLIPQKDGSYIAKPQIPDRGWKAVFVEVELKMPDGTLIDFTSQLFIVPDTLPYPECGRMCSCKDECDKPFNGSSMTILKNSSSSIIYHPFVASRGSFGSYVAVLGIISVVVFVLFSAIVALFRLFPNFRTEQK